MENWLTQNMAWLLPVAGGLLASIIANFKAVAAKVNTLVLEYEQVADADLLEKYNDNPLSKNKAGYTEHQRANALRKRLVITEVKKSWLFCPNWLICVYIKGFCKLNKLPKLKQVVDTVIDTVVKKVESAAATLVAPDAALAADVPQTAKVLPVIDRLQPQETIASAQE